MDPILGIFTRPKQSPGTLANLFLLGACLLLNPGCVFEKYFHFQPDHGIQPVQPHLSQQAMIEHINQNIRALHSWSCTDAAISTRPSKFLPMKLTLSANISVERDKNFRLLASSPFGQEADFGSNNERFWFWMRRNKPPYVFTAQHADMAAVGRRLQIPFDPAWIMEALGVVPLDPNSITIQQQGMDPNTMLFVSEVISPSQTVVRKEIVVDTHLGVVLAHRLYDANGQRLAEARLSRHHREPSGIIMPHEIELEWPQYQMAMTMELTTIDVNPSHLPERTWQLPDSKGLKVFDMSQRLNHVEAPGPHEPAGERIMRSTTYLEPPPFAGSTSPKAAWQQANAKSFTRTAAKSSEPEPPPFY